MASGGVGSTRCLALLLSLVLLCATISLVIAISLAPSGPREPSPLSEGEESAEEEEVIVGEEESGGGGNWTGPPVSTYYVPPYTSFTWSGVLEKGDKLWIHASGGLFTITVYGPKGLVCSYTTTCIVLDIIAEAGGEYEVVLRNISDGYVMVSLAVFRSGGEAEGR